MSKLEIRSHRKVTFRKLRLDNLSGRINSPAPITDRTNVINDDADESAQLRKVSSNQQPFPNRVAYLIRRDIITLHASSLLSIDATDADFVSSSAVSA